MSKLLSALIYYLIVIPISYLPFGLLYIISDIVFVVLYYVVGYRKKVVQENIAHSFPNLNSEERKDIEKKFYKHFADFLVESAKSLSISNKSIQERCAIINPEMANKHFEQGKDVIVLCGHYNNWEYYAVGLAQQMKHQVIAAYHPLKNGYFNEKILQARQRFGLKMVSMKQVPRFFADPNGKAPTLTVMLNDQSPGDPKNAYWNTFLNQETGWMRGAEKLAKKYNQVVLFGSIHKKKRGFYEVQFQLISENIEVEKEGYVLDKHAELLEKIIRQEPEYWLWSHRRWKHKRPN
ncbi:MAG TPA: lysophospholipid acyltransferase family protein [Brumimicrobium sp.]|nr:lysophospholipid acyltransferase family protein [Brumimicrobium sp.]